MMIRFLLKEFLIVAKLSKKERIMFRQIISQKLFLFPVLALAGLLTVAPPAFSQTGGMERRDDRRGGRQEKRGEKQEGRSEAKDARQEGRESGDRSAGRQEARDAKQTGRQEGRDAKHGGGEDK
jgi:hypothetical protein